MWEEKAQYQQISSKRLAIRRELELLRNNEYVKKYFPLRKEEEKLEQEQEHLFVDLKNKEYATCSHIWIVSDIERDPYEGRSYRYSGCIKCGLEEIVMERSIYNSSNMDFEHKIMYDFMSKNSYKRGIRTNRYCDLELARAIYQKVKENHLDIDDQMALKYLEIALDNMRHIKVNEDRKVSRAKRLSLDPDFFKSRFR